MLSPSRFRMLFNQLNAPVKKVYEAVPMTDAWNHSQIIAELQRNGHSMRDMNAVLGCLDTLRRHGLVSEPHQGAFIRVQIKDPKPPAIKAVTPHPEQPDAVLEVKEEPKVITPQENEVATTMQIKAVKAAPKQTPIDRLGTLAAQAGAYAEEAKKLSDKMKTLASELETVAIEIEDDVMETAKLADQLKQLKQLLKGLD